MTPPTTEVSPVQQSVRVPVEPARAFKIFTAGVRDWWIRAYSANPTKAPIADIVIEPRVGGRWFERGTDGSESDWARVRVWEPGARLCVEWQPAGQQPTEIEVRFDGPAPRATNVTVIQRGFESYGEDATRMRDAHDVAWTDLLRRYATVLGESRQKDEPAVERGAHAHPRAVTDGETVLATLEIAGTPERIFRALTTAETEAWWGAPDTYQATEWQADLRVHGRWSVVIRLPDGSPFPASGEFTEIDAPRRLVQTRRYDFDYPELGRRDTVVTYLLDPTSTGTRITVRQDGFAGLRGPADHHAEGWEGFLKYLASYVEAHPE